MKFFFGWIFYFFVSLPLRFKKQYFFSKSLKFDKFSNLSADIGTIIFGKISCFNNSKILLGKNIVINREAVISADNNSEIIIGDNCQIAQGVSIYADLGSKIKMGSNTTFFSNVLISGNVMIGNGVLFSSNINVLSTTHCIEGRGWIRDLDKEYIIQNGKLNDKPIIIEDECWIGLNVVIMPGTVLGRGCVVGANSVVKGSFGDFSIIGGVPGKLIKYR